jgi:hypothetical protein
MRSGGRPTTPARDAAGLSNCRVSRTLDDPNDLFVVCDVADVEKAKAFTTSKRLAGAMQAAGVIGRPEVYFLTPAN